VNIDPPNAKTVQSMLLDEIDNFLMRDTRRLPHLPVVVQEPMTTAGVSHEKLAVYQVVSDDLATHEQGFQAFEIRRSIG